MTNNVELFYLVEWLEEIIVDADAGRFLSLGPTEKPADYYHGIIDVCNYIKECLQGDI